MSFCIWCFLFPFWRRKTIPYTGARTEDGCFFFVVKYHRRGNIVVGDVSFFAQTAYWEIQTKCLSIALVDIFAINELFIYTRISKTVKAVISQLQFIQTKRPKDNALLVANEYGREPRIRSPTDNSSFVFSI